MECDIAEIVDGILHHLHGSVELVGRLSTLEGKQPSTIIGPKVVCITSILEVDVVHGHTDATGLMEVRWSEKLRC